MASRQSNRFDGRPDSGGGGSDIGASGGRLPDRCPICKARRRPGSPEAALACHRCGCDLSVPVAILEEAGRFHRQSIACAARGRLADALNLNTRAIHLYRDDAFVVWQLFLNELRAGGSERIIE